MMADGKNDARAIRVMEIMNDFRTIHYHLESLVHRQESRAPDQASLGLPGYAIIRECEAQCRRILGSNFNPGNYSVSAGEGEPEALKAALQRITLDASCRRFRSHKIYLQASAATRWIQMRNQVLRSHAPTTTTSSSSSSRAQALRKVDQRLGQELSEITDDHVYNDLRSADRHKGYWLDDDPPLGRIISWIRTQR